MTVNGLEKQSLAGVRQLAPRRPIQPGVRFDSKLTLTLTLTLTYGRTAGKSEDGRTAGKSEARKAPRDQEAGGAMAGKSEATGGRRGNRDSGHPVNRPAYGPGD